MFEARIRNPDRAFVLRFLLQAFGSLYKNGQWKNYVVKKRDENGFVLFARNSLGYGYEYAALETNVLAQKISEAGKEYTDVMIYFAVDQDGDRVDPENAWGFLGFAEDLYEFMEDKFLPYVKSRLEN